MPKRCSVTSSRLCLGSRGFTEAKTASQRGGKGIRGLRGLTGFPGRRNPSDTRPRSGRSGETRRAVKMKPTLSCEGLIFTALLVSLPRLRRGSLGFRYFRAAACQRRRGQRDSGSAIPSVIIRLIRLIRGSFKAPVSPWRVARRRTQRGCERRGYGWAGILVGNGSISSTRVPSRSKRFNCHLLLRPTRGFCNAARAAGGVRARTVSQAAWMSATSRQA